MSGIPFNTSTLFISPSTYNASTMQNSYTAIPLTVMAASEVYSPQAIEYVDMTHIEQGAGQLGDTSTSSDAFEVIPMGDGSAALSGPRVLWGTTPEQLKMAQANLAQAAGRGVWQFFEQPELVVASVRDTLQKASEQKDESRGLMAMGADRGSGSGDKDIMSDERILRLIVRVHSFGTEDKEAIRELARIGVPAVARFIDDNDHAVSAVAINALGRLGDASALEHLKKAFKSDDDMIRMSAVQAIAMLKHEDVVSLLIDALKDTSSFVRSAAAYDLGIVGNRNAVEPLIERLGDADEKTVYVAIGALGRLKDPRAVEPLMNIVRNGIPHLDLGADRSADFRTHAMEAIAELNHIGAFDHLIEGLKDSHPLVRSIAAVGLGKLRDARALDHLGKAHAVEVYSNVKRSIEEAILDIINRDVPD